MKRLLWLNMILGVWLMISPFLLMLMYPGVLRVTWEDFIFGFLIAIFSLCRLFSRSSGEILIMDWLVTAVGILTLLNPILYDYYNVALASWNNLLVGGIVFLVAMYLDWKDSDPPLWQPGHHRAH